MKTMRKFAWLVALSVVAFSIPGSASAALIHNLSTDFGSGSITFLDESGNDPNRVAAFSFDVTSGPGSPQSYGLGDIDSITWSINEFWDLTLNLISDAIPFGDDLSVILLSNDGLFQTVSCPDVGGVQTLRSATVVCFGDGVATEFSDLATEAVHDAPEPASLALFVIALGGLGFMARRRMT